MNVSVSVRLLILCLVFVAVLIASNLFLKQARLDLTDQKLYSLSEGTHNIIHSISEPIRLRLFYSDKATADLVQFRAYAQRVKELLEEYVMVGGNKLTLEVIDPAPFSEDEDAAVEQGLQGVPVEAGGEDAYFGLVAEDSAGHRAKIPFFQPSREAFLEYEISQMIYRVGKPELPRLGVVTDFDVGGGYSMRTGQPQPAWMVFEQLKQLFKVEFIDSDPLEIDQDLDILLLVQPTTMQERSLYAIEQYILRGGHTLIFQDPYFESGPMGPMSMPKDADWPLQKLLDHWGLEIPKTEAVVDKELAMVVSMGGNRPPMRHGGLLAVNQNWMRSEDVAAADLEKVTFSAAGYLQQKEGSQVRFESLLTSSNQAMPKPTTLFRGLKDPDILFEDFQPVEQPLVIAGRISGKLTSAFETIPELQIDPEQEATEGEAAPKDEVDLAAEDAEALGSDEEEERRSPNILDLPQLHQGDHVQVLLVADVDVLTDRMWVDVQEIFGQRVAAPWADNGAFVTNAIDNLAGNADLISIRSRGRYSRPFEVVERLQKVAEERFLNSERALRKRLDETEKQLAQLESPGDSENLSLTPEQKEAIAAFQKEKVKIRKELREVRRELDKDIDALHTRLKVVNIGAMPVLVTLFALLVAGYRRYRRRTFVRA